jgi:hypothetical protein
MVEIKCESALQHCSFGARAYTPQLAPESGGPKLLKERGPPKLFKEHGPAHLALETFELDLLGEGRRPSLAAIPAAQPNPPKEPWVDLQRIMERRLRVWRYDLALLIEAEELLRHALPDLLKGHVGPRLAARAQFDRVLDHGQLGRLDERWLPRLRGRSLSSHERSAGRGEHS